MAQDNKKPALSSVLSFDHGRTDEDIRFMLTPVEQLARGSLRVDDRHRLKPLVQFKATEKHTYKLSKDERYVTCYSGQTPIWQRSVSSEEAKAFK